MVPVRMNPLVTGVLLAAGGGRRLGGRPKALLMHRGRPLVEHAIRSLRDGGCDRIVVVLGAAADEVRSRSSLAGCAVTVNPEWQQGMGGSLRAGLAALAGTGTEAALVLLVDQPGVGAEAVSRVRAAHTSRASLAAASYHGTRGHPVLLGADHWAGVSAGATGDQGARAHLWEHRAALTLVECADVADAYDIDTPEDLRHLAGP
ncbi:NTP transferase domain-containing protein [Streptomyces sp. NPDC005576]|uniref:nucleotidyltransferase family protein n=1 Tax=Streptomyces sp. NPDC005576 TaxID=3364726 RepID=UPI0036D0397E